MQVTINISPEDAYKASKAKKLDSDIVDNLHLSIKRAVLDTQLDALKISLAEKDIDVPAMLATLNSNR